MDSEEVKKKLKTTLADAIAKIKANCDVQLNVLHSMKEDLPQDVFDTGIEMLLKRQYATEMFESTGDDLYFKEVKRLHYDYKSFFECVVVKTIEDKYGDLR